MADYWAKIYIEIIDDPKMATMPDRLWRRTIELFLLAKKFNNGGHLPDTKQLAWILRMTTDELDLDLKQISQTGIVKAESGGWFVVQFEKRQSASTSTERSQQFRKRTQANQYYDNDATQLQRNVAQSTETDTETDTEPNAANDTLFRKLSVATANALHLAELTPNPKSWNDAITKMVKAEITPADIIQAAADLPSRYSIVGAQSIVTPAIIAKGKRERGNGNHGDPYHEYKNE
jgi:hypothetical protein